VKLKLTENDKKALVVAAIILAVVFTVMHFVLKLTPLVTVTNPN
jgi:membrane protease YdiL (CAAX protease family)